ncbi:MAG: hypothetical protein HUK03_07450, partial [Bacteroidaceae bacterium]|nr:hypothetical protein [Bacteroidaceae bacterium]
GSSTITHPLPISLWIYNRYVGSTSRFGKWMFNHFSSKPVFISTVNPRTRVSVARNTLHNFGYFRGKVGYDTIPMKNPRKAKLAYKVTPGELFHLDSISYTNFTEGIDTLVLGSLQKSLIHKGDAFRSSNLDDERKRIAQLLRNKGYFYYRPEFIHYNADTIMRPLHVQLKVEQNPNTSQKALHPYYIGKTMVRILRNGDRQTTDTLPERQGFTFAYSGNKKKPLIRPFAVRRLMFYDRGDLYRERMHELWQQKMSESGLFSQVKTEYVPRDTSATCDTLDMVVTATLDKPFDAKLEARGTIKSNGQVGPALSFSVTKANAFRGAETLGGDVWGSYEWQTGANLQGDRAALNSYEFGGSIHLTYPRLMFFGLGRRLGRRSVASTRFKLNARCQSRAGYYGRVTFGAHVTYKMQFVRGATHEFSPFKLEYEMQYSSSDKYWEIVRENPSLYISMRDQFVPSMEYIYTWRRA